jgi:two-component system sensor histidine kinase SenX3
VDGEVAALLAALVGLLTGAAAVLAVQAARRRAGAARSASEDVADGAGRGEPGLPAGIVGVLSALRSSAVVLDGADTVVTATHAASSMGVVRGDRVVVDQLLRMARRVRRDGGVGQAELDLPRGPFGSETFHVSARVARLDRGLVLVLVEDLTEARRVDAVRRDFVANVSHELKTPVGALSLLAEAVLDASADPEAVRRFAGRMQHESVRLSELVQELIDLSRLQGQDPLREPAVVDVDEVVEEAVDRCRLAASARRITLATGGQQGQVVLGDAGQLVTALRNLIDNAVNYSAEGTRVAVGVRRAMEVGDTGAAGDAGAVLEISVTDQGIGIPETDLERVFERFYRVDPARSRATGGTGLGLSIVKHITANHGGEVTVWSVAGSGSTFTMRLPGGGTTESSTPDTAPVHADATARKART